MGCVHEGKSAIDPKRPKMNKPRWWLMFYQVQNLNFICIRVIDEEWRKEASSD